MHVAVSMVRTGAHNIFQLNSSTMRKLALHASALSDTEYGLFMKSLREIIDDETPPNTEDSDAHFEQMSIGVREARAWFRGRYSRVSASVIDGVCVAHMEPYNVLNGMTRFSNFSLRISVKKTR